MTESERAPLAWRWTAVLGVLVVLVGAAVLVATFWSWRTVEEAAAAAKPRTPNAVVDVSVYGLGFTVTQESALLLLVIASALAGSYVHLATSFASFVGNRELTASWVWWYLLRVFIGSALAVVGYFTFRAGFLSSGASAQQVNTFGVAALAGLTGLFSKQATDKLREVFDTVFKVGPGYGDQERDDPLTTPTPQPEIVSVEPDTVSEGTQALTVVLHGRNFTTGATVLVNDVERNANVQSDDVMTADLTAQDLRGPSIQLVVKNPTGARSAPITVTVGT